MEPDDDNNNIPKLWFDPFGDPPGWRFFTPEEDKLLGTMTDVMFGKKFNRSRHSVEAISSR